MAHPLIKHILYGALCAGVAFTIVGCTDDSYDLDKVDLTMGIGSEGLSVTLGNTEKICLKDILEEDKSVKTDVNNLYYLVKSETMGFNFNVKKVSTSINSPEIVSRVLSSANMSTQTIPTGYITSGKADGNKPVNFSVNFTEDDIKTIKNIEVQPTNISLILSQKGSTKLTVKEIKNLKIMLPQYMHVKALTSGWTLAADNTLTCNTLAGNKLGTKICDLTLTSLDINKSVTDRKLYISDNARVTANVTYTNVSGATIQWKNTDYADIVLNINVGTGNSTTPYALNVNQVTGKFTPTINPEIKKINIQEDLPDFLNDENAKADVSNPTLRLNSNLTTIPVGVNVGCTMLPYKNGTEITANKVVVTNSGLAMDANQKDVVYLYKGSAPYDPEGVISTDSKKQVSNLNNLMKTIPDYILCNMQNKQVVVQDKEYTVKLGQNYSGNITYTIFVPFEFNSGLQIAYRDSTNSLNSDLKKYSAKGIQLTTDAENSIPLDLKISIEAYDVNGHKVSGIAFKDNEGHDYVVIPASANETTTKKSLELNAELAVPENLSKVDRFRFKVETANTEIAKSHKLISSQYLKLNNIKLRLKGGITIDFN